MMTIRDVMLCGIEYLDQYDLDGVTYGQGLFNPEWVTSVSPNPKVLFDVGCYDCGDSIKLKKRFPTAEVYAFEASPLRHEKLYQTTKRYNINFVPTAVHEFNGFETFYDSLVDDERVDAQGSFYRHTETYKTANPRIIQKQEGTKIPCITIETFCLTRKIDQIDLLHIDVEGAEFQVIKGLGAVRPKMIFVETLDLVNTNNEAMWTGGATKSIDMENYLFSIGYKLVRVLEADRLYVLRSAL